MSSLSGSNGSARTEHSWEPESPFLSDVGATNGVGSVTSASQVFAPPTYNESPFVAEYVGQYDGGGARAEMFAELVSELSDQEFNEALDDLVNEAIAVAEDRFTSEAPDPAAEQLDAER